MTINDPHSNIDDLGIQAGFQGRVAVGKDILELLSSSMYVDPLTVYREYVQNAADSIDEAIALGELSDISEGHVDIRLDHIQRRAIIRDNGAGLNEDEFVQRMTSFGASAKRGTSARGFRGVGRLAGLGYCQGLKFRSRTKEAKRVIQVNWNCRLLKKLLLSTEFVGNLEDLVQQVVSVSWADEDDYPDRFFEVEIVKPRRIGNDQLLNELEINSYLSQVGPCPFHPEFNHAEEIREILGPLKTASREYQIFLNESMVPIYRPYSDTIVFSDTKVSQVRCIEEIKIDGIDGNLAASGWVMHHDYQGAIPTKLGVKGLRARVGNMQIGDSRIFSNVFPEERFCSWTVGEVHLVDDKIFPNGRRDNFESNNNIANVVTHLTPYGSGIARRCRKNSRIRNQEKSFDLAEQRILEKIEIIDQGAISRQNIKKLKGEIEAHLSDIKHLASLDFLDDRGKTRMLTKTANLAKLANSLSGKKKSNDPLKNMSKAKEKTYNEIFDLVYECSANRILAKSLIDRILSRIS